MHTLQKKVKTKKIGFGHPTPSPGIVVGCGECMWACRMDDGRIRLNQRREREREREMKRKFLTKNNSERKEAQT